MDLVPTSSLGTSELDREREQAAGSMLRPRYRHDWNFSQPRWKLLRSCFEDWQSSDLSPLVIDATRIRDGKQVMLRQVADAKTSRFAMCTARQGIS
ncbi:hypothetical protein FA95DRAFT_1614321 [Auriscalpium vulgare]|uniref:Uncharacterized protein n=1 Tax=Auriscalpium vulgare TaxID=40419 RepID=A0ACB8R1B8_9AGAM|nr:hypothetical protein FA95DRAFT_1614321 [Auriscalpium vulgare]